MRVKAWAEGHEDEDVLSPKLEDAILNLAQIVYDKYYEEGRESYNPKLKPLQECPYPSGIRRDAWIAGFNDWL